MRQNKRILDLFCCAGGAAKGYSLAGFEVVGVDKTPQPRYPYAFVKMDALMVLSILLSGDFISDNRGRRWYLSDFDAIHASPPCQKYTVAQNATKNADAHPDLVEPVRDLLQKTGKLYVIENVVGAPLEDPKVLCGISFGLKVRRHRLFETNFYFLVPPDQCKNEEYYVIFGESIRSRRHGEKAGKKNYLAIGKEAMGIDWMTCAELSQAIPPAYTCFIGEQLNHYLCQE